MKAKAELNKPTEYVYLQEVGPDGVFGQFCRVPTMEEQTPARVMEKIREMSKGRVSLWMDDGVIRYTPFPKGIWFVLFNGVILKKDSEVGGVP